MPMAVRYTTVDGQVLCENRGGVKTLFMPDTLGNVIETRNMDTGAQTSSTTYWPYGEVRTQTGTNPSPFGFCGVWGYYTQPGQPTYVRARYYRPNLGRWQTVDPLWPRELPYSYADSLPVQDIDPAGLSSYTGYIAANCPPGIRNTLNGICQVLSAPFSPSSKLSELNECLSRGASKLGISCPGFSGATMSCLRNFCSLGIVSCDNETYCTPGRGATCGTTIGPKLPWGDGHDADRLFPIGTINLCPNLNDRPGCCSHGVSSPIASVALHEMLHACGWGHGPVHDGKERENRRGLHSCNGIGACCIYNILLKGKSGRPCWDKLSWS